MNGLDHVLYDGALKKVKELERLLAESRSLNRDLLNQLDASTKLATENANLYAAALLKANRQLHTEN